MAQRTNLSWVALLVIALALGGAAKWWSADHEPRAEETSAAGTAASAAQAAEAPASSPAVSVPVTPDEAALVAQQAAAAKEVERNPGMKAIDGPITERPAFVSELEWQMLKGVAQQKPDPALELTHLVNNLRFMKQLELYQSLNKPGDLTQRQTVAEQLLSDLPQRVAGGDMGKAEAIKLQSDLLHDLVADPKTRKARSETEARRLSAPPLEPPKS